MSEAIRDRRPTEADADSAGTVELWQPGERRWVRWTAINVTDSDIWRPIDQTPPPEPEKRRTWHTQVNKRGELQGKASPRMDYETVRVLEVLPGDPDDLDALLEAIDSRNPSNLIDWSENVLRARHSEGGDV